jgi:hypothetical protein
MVYVTLHIVTLMRDSLAVVWDTTNDVKRSLSKLWLVLACSEYNQPPRAECNVNLTMSRGVKFKKGSREPLAEVSSIVRSISPTVMTVSSCDS